MLEPIDKNRPPLMTEQRAKEILSRPLVFGNPEQIEAKHYLDDLEEARENAELWDIF